MGQLSREMMGEYSGVCLYNIRTSCYKSSLNVIEDNIKQSSTGINVKVQKAIMKLLIEILFIHARQLI